MPSVLFVCTANQCRSPLAQGLFQLELNGQLTGWRIDSAGTWAVEGLPPSPKTLQILQEKGIELSSQRSKPVDRNLLQSFALILTMEGGQKEALQVEFPEQREKIYLLSEMIGAEYDIQDPVGGDWEAYQRTAAEIANILKLGFERIKTLASQNENDPK